MKQRLICVCVPYQGYGAYLTLMMLKSTDSLFKCACAMSPVTDWRLYGEFRLTTINTIIR